MAPRPWPDGRTPVLLTSHAEDLLATDAAALGGYLDRTAADPAAVAAHLLATRRIRRHRAVIRAADRAELRAGLAAVAAGTEHSLVCRSAELAGTRVAFVLPGQGSQWPGMGAQAYATLTDYRAAADECGAAFTAAGLVSPVRYLTGDGPTAFTEIEIEGAQFVHHVALAAVWRAHGVLPDITIGHSLGEVAAAHLAGALTLPDAVRVVATRAGVVNRLAGDYAVAALGISAAAAHEVIQVTPGWLELSVVNAETSVAVSGERAAVRAVIEKVRSGGGLAREITVNFPVHTSVLEPLRDTLHPHWPSGEFDDTAVQFIGGTTGTVVGPGTSFAEYWYRNLRDMVRFDRAVESAIGRGAGIFVELSAHPALQFAVAQVLGDRPAVLIGSGRREGAPADEIAAGLTAVAAADPTYRWRAHHRAGAGVLRDVPGVAMRAERLWLTRAPESVAAPAVTTAAERWIAIDPVRRSSPPEVAVLGLGPGMLAATVRDALERHPGARPASSEDAEVLIVVAPDGLDDPDVALTTEALAQLAGAGVLGYGTAIGKRCRAAYLVTVRGELVEIGDPPASPGHAALAAMHRAIGFEYPDVAFGQLDLPSADADPDRVLDAVLGSSGTLALRGEGERSILLRRSFVEAPAPAVASVNLDEVVITGGSGGIATQCVRALIGRGARRIVLLGRRGIDPPTLAALRGEHPTELVSVPCDIRDRDSVAAVAARYGATGATLVIHAAGTADFRVAADLDGAAVSENFGAKVLGLAHLTRNWPLRHDARILLCSSVSGLWGGRGHAAYGAANRVLDVMAAQLRASGRDCSTLRFGLWDASSAIVDDAEAVNVTRSGLRPMAPEAAVDAMLSGAPGDPLIYSADARRLAMFLDAEPAEHPVQPGADAAAVVQAELAAVLDIAHGAVDLGESLFDLGVDSLLAVDLRKRLKGRLGCTVALATLLSGVTGNQIVSELETEGGPRVTDVTDMDGRIDGARHELMRRRLAERGLAAPAAVEPPDPGGLSDGQRRMWFVAQADPSGALLNVCVSYRITGPVDVDRLHGAVDTVARRHAALRTTYRTDENGDPQPVVHDQLSVGWAVHDLTELAGTRAQQLRLEVLAQREFGTPFDLTADAPLRITVLRTAPDELVLLLVAHHIAWDDGSGAVFFSDLTRAYTDAPLGPPTLPGEDTRSEAQREDDLSYWRAVMSDPPEPLELPGPNGSQVPTTWRSASTTRHLSARTIARVTEAARAAGATPYMVLLAAFGATVFRYTHTGDFLVATPVVNRGGRAEDTIGYFGNTVAIRMRMQAGTTFAELLADTREAALGAFAHQRINLDRVVSEINPDRRHGAERMTRISFGFREPDGGGFAPPGIRCQRADLRGHNTQLPLGFMVEFTDSGAVIEAEHLVEILDPVLVAQLLDHFVVLLESALAQPETPLCRLALIDPDALRWLHEVSAGERFSTEPTTLAGLIEAQVQRTPDAVAVVYEGRRYTYAEINAAANQVAHWLIAAGIGPEDRVAVLLDKSVELIVMALGVAKAGGVYLPVDPTYPAERLDFILGDCDAKLVVREPITDLDGQRSDNPTDADRVRALTPDNTAYLIYTSGTTGQPKGVPVPHRPIAEYFVWFQGDYGVDASDRLLQVASPSFDVSIAEVFGTLACGARIVVHRPGGLSDIGYLTDLLRDEGITAMHFVPSLLGLFLSLPGVNQWRTLQRVPIGGEPLPGEVADKFHATFDALLHNFYGPTETVVNASRFKVEGKQGTGIVPIGTPKINTTMYLLDDALQPVPVGVIGEIYIGGTHIARGYHRRPGLTAERFIADPFTPGARMYRSGDLARRNADGDIEFVGRADEQVKIRGFRIELGDVAAAISVDPSVGQAVVVVSELSGLGRSLVGYLTPVSGEPLESVDVERIRARVAAALPEYMVPAGYVVLPEIPLTAHGKIDRAALPEPEIAAGTPFREPSSGTERRLAELFGELLGRDRVGADDSFFELGGHSLLATKLVAAVRNSFGLDIGVREVFELSTVAELAAHLDGPGARRVRPPLTARYTGTNGDHPREPAPLSSAQLRSWFAYRVDGPSAVNNIPFAAELRGPWDIDAALAAISDVVARHEILRTTYREIDGVPHQIVHPPAAVPVRRASAVDGDDVEAWLTGELDRERTRILDLERDWPIRAAVLRTPDKHVLSLVLHHIAGDHWSAGVLFADLATAYRARRRGAAPDWAALAAQYADFAAWHTALLAGDTGLAEPQRAYWREQLAGLPTEAGLRPDFPRPPVLGGDAGAVEFRLDAGLRDQLATLARDLGVTEFMLLQSAVAVALHKAGAGPDVPVGTPVAGRTVAELDDLIGFFINILTLRNDLHGNPTLREVLLRGRDMALGAYANQDLPFDQVVDAVGPVRSLSRNPLFGVVVHVRDELPADQVIDSTPDGEITFTALEPTFDAAHADLSVNFFAGPDGYRGHAIYRTALYRPETAGRFVGWLRRVLEAFAYHPDRALADLDVADPAERARITDWSSRGGVRVLGSDLRPVPVGVVGDVYLDGALAGSRLPAAVENAIRLVPDPAGTQGGARLFRTGERARWDDHGQLELLPRGSPSASEAVAVRQVSPDEPPATGTEQALADILVAVLAGSDVGAPPDERIGRYDDFFELGGDSILAVQVAARAKDAGLPLTARMVFEHPVLAELAAAIDISAAAATGEATQEDAPVAPMAASGLTTDELAELTASWDAP